MKLFRLFPFVALLSVLALTSCNEEIDFAGDYQKTAVVYGLLNQADSIHYIKITRPFAGNNNAPVVAQIPDSSYFPVLTATVSEVINGNVTRSWVLDDTILTNKQPGVFYSPDQKVYYFKADDLVATAKYKLDVNINNGEFHVYGETSMVQGLALTSPTTLGSYAFASSNVTDNGYKSTNVVMNAGNAEVLDGRIEVFFNEYIGGVPTEKSFMWKLGEMKGSEIGSVPRFIANGATFYQLIRENVTDNPAIDKREFTRMKIYITGGTADLNKYLLVNQPSSSITQSKPTFTNLSASEGAKAIGIFTARHTIVQERLKFINTPPYARAIDANSIKELCTGGFTGDLFFCSDHPNDQTTTYYCN